MSGRGNRRRDVGTGPSDLVPPPDETTLGTEYRTLTPDEQARALQKLRALERAAMFTSDDGRVSLLVAEWTSAVRVGSLAPETVAAIAADLQHAELHVETDPSSGIAGAGSAVEPTGEGDSAEEWRD